MGVQIAIADTMATIEATCSDGYPAEEIEARTVPEVVRFMIPTARIYTTLTALLQFYESGGQVQIVWKNTKFPSIRTGNGTIPFPTTWVVTTEEKDGGKIRIVGETLIVPASRLRSLAEWPG